LTKQQLHSIILEYKGIFIFNANDTILLLYRFLGGVVLNRIVNGNHLAPTAFVENIEYTGDYPYILVVKKFANDEITLPHYANSIEIIICNGLSGHIKINNNQYDLSGKKLFYISPNYMHSTYVKKNSGVMYVLKISPEFLTEQINIETILNSEKCSINACPFEMNNVLPVFDIIEKFIQYDSDAFKRLTAIIEMFDYIRENLKVSENNSQVNVKANSDVILKKLIEWTEAQRGSKQISTRAAAKFVGYSEHYFCHWFKETTGMTYHEYLNYIKIGYSCKLLEQGRSVSETSAELGYLNTSYFIRMFKKYKGQTPNTYAKQNRQMDNLTENKFI
jgi:AraC-like DNA-binding protein